MKKPDDLLTSFLAYLVIAALAIAATNKIVHFLASDWYHLPPDNAEQRQNKR